MATEDELPSDGFTDISRIREERHDDDHLYGEDLFGGDDSFKSIGWSANEAGSSVISNDADSFDMLIRKQLADNNTTEKVSSQKNTKEASYDTASTELSSKSESFDLKIKKKKLGFVDENSFPDNPSLNWSVSDESSKSTSSNKDLLNVCRKFAKQNEINPMTSFTSASTVSSTEDDSIEGCMRTKDLDFIDGDNSDDDSSSDEIKSDAGKRIEEYDKRAQLVEQNGLDISNVSSRRIHKPLISVNPKIPQTLKPAVSEKVDNHKGSTPPHLVDKVLVLHRTDKQKEDNYLAENRKRMKSEDFKKLTPGMGVHSYHIPKRSHSRNFKRSRSESHIENNKILEKIKEDSEMNITSVPHHILDDEEKAFNRLEGGVFPHVVEDFDVNHIDISTIDSSAETEDFTPNVMISFNASFQNKMKSIQHNEIEEFEDLIIYYPQIEKDSKKQKALKHEDANEANKNMQSKTKAEENLKKLEILLLFLIVSAAISLFVLLFLLLT